MGRAGPPKTPQALKILRGTDRKDRRVSTPAEPTPLIAKPEFTDRKASQIWDRLAPRLLRLGLLTENDAEALEKLCHLEALFQRAQREVEGWGDDLWWKSEKGFEGPRACIGTMHKTHEKLMPLYARFGMTPSDRNNVEAHPVSQPANPFTRLGKTKAKGA